MHATCAGAKFISAERSEAEPASAARRARRRRNPRYGAALVNLRLPTSAVWPIGQTGRPLWGCRLAIRHQRGACGFLCRSPKKYRSTVSFGNISKGNRGAFFFAACLANPELRLKHLRAPRDRPRHARHATGVFSFVIPFQRAGGRSRSTVTPCGCFALVLRVRADMPRRGWGSAIVTSFLFECTWRGAPPPQAVPLSGA